MTPDLDIARLARSSRRGFFESMADGLFGAALLQLWQHDGLVRSASAADAAHDSGVPAGAPVYDLTPKLPSGPPRAKAVIQLFMQGGPSQVDLFDPKEALEKFHGRSAFKELAADVSSPEAAGGLMRSPFRFARYGECGAPVSELLPHFAQHVDEVAIIRSMFNSHPNHEPALFKIQSGKLLPGLPSLGSWIVYGLGSENQNLPAYVVLDDPQSRLPVNTVQNWQSGYLPPVYQGTRVRPTGTPILNLKPDTESPGDVDRLSRELLRRLDTLHHVDRSRNPQLAARLSSYELAARMQMYAAEALDVSSETAATQALYGVDDPKTDNFGRRCLMARRLVERGVRFVQLFTRGQAWDNHTNIGTSLRQVCEETDKPVAALLADLKQRGLMNDVLVLWGGEFGRLPAAQMRPGTDPAKAGRDHGPAGFSVWMAGAGIRPGVSYGNTDDIGYKAVDKPVSVADWHGTILHLLGLHHEHLHFARNGFKEKLTATEPVQIVRDILT